MAGSERPEFERQRADRLWRRENSGRRSRLMRGWICIGRRPGPIRIGVRSSAVIEAAEAKF